MAWETRQGTGRYYTRSYREGGRVVREYVGSGHSAQLVAEADRSAREEREAARMRERWEREKLRALVAPALEIDEAVAALVRAELVAAGYHEHKGEWRRGRSYPRS